MCHIKGCTREEGHQRSPSAGFITLAQGSQTFGLVGHYRFQDLTVRTKQEQMDAVFQ